MTMRKLIGATAISLLSTAFLSFSTPSSSTKLETIDDQDNTITMSAATNSSLASTISLADVPANNTANDNDKNKTEDNAIDNSETVGARLVFLFDSSGSIDNTEYQVQLDAMADALGSQDFRDAIFFDSGPGSVAICFADYGSSAAVRIDWVEIRKGDDKKLKELADRVANLERRESGSTSHAAGFNLAAERFKNCPWPSDRNIVNITTDGKTNQDRDILPQSRDNLIRNYKATINALVTIVYGEEDLDVWSGEHLTTPTGFYKNDKDILEPGFYKIVADQVSERNNGGISKHKDAMRWAFQRSLVIEPG